MVERIRIEPERFVVRNADGKITFDSNHTEYLKCSAAYATARIHAMGPGLLLANRQSTSSPGLYAARFGAGWVCGGVPYMGIADGGRRPVYSPPWPATMWMLQPTRAWGAGSTAVFSATWRLYDWFLYKRDGGYLSGPIYAQCTGYGPAGAAWGTLPTGYVWSAYGFGFSGMSMVPGDSFLFSATKAVIKFTQLPYGSWIDGMDAVSSWQIAAVATASPETLPLVVV